MHFLCTCYNFLAPGLSHGVFCFQNILHFHLCLFKPCIFYIHMSPFPCSFQENPEYSVCLLNFHSLSYTFLTVFSPFCVCVCVCMCVSCLVVSDSLQPHRPQPTRPLCPWDSPGKNTGVGCHFLLRKELQKERK